LLVKNGKFEKFRFLQAYGLECCIGVDAKQKIFIDALAGVTDPEASEKAMEMHYRGFRRENQIKLGRS